MLARRTKTFVENAYWQRTPGGGPGSWRMLPRSDSGEVPLDQQIREWVEQTGAIIIHPGQLGMHMQWLDPALTLRCVSLGLTVLYVERADYEQSKPQTTPGALPVADPDPDWAYRDDANAACAPDEFGEAALAAGDDARATIDPVVIREACGRDNSSGASQRYCRSSKRAVADG